MTAEPKRSQVRAAVDDFLVGTASFRQLPPERQVQIAQDTTQVVSDLGGGSATNELIQDVDFPAFVAGLIHGAFHAIVHASIQQMEAYGSLMKSVAASLGEFRNALTKDVPVVIGWPVSANWLVVDVTPRGMEPAQAGIALIEVELSYIDALNYVRDIRTTGIRTLADTFRWAVAIRDSNRRTYQYRTTLHLLTGELRVGSWTTSSERILVIPIVAV
jgi:hypothetical protein